MTTSLANRLSPFEVARQAGQGELNVYNDNFFLPYGITRTSRSLTLPPNLPQEDWVKVVSFMLEQRDMLPFYIADALRFGEKTYGISFAAGVEMAGASEQLIGKLLSLQRVAPAQRRASLSEDHHLAVAGLAPEGQERALGNAEHYKLSVEGTRMEAAGIRKTTEQHQPNSGQVKPVMQRVSLTVEAIFSFAKGLTFEEQHRLSALLDKSVRTFGTGQLHIDGDVPTAALFENVPDDSEADTDPGEEPPVIVIDLRDKFAGEGGFEMVALDGMTHTAAAGSVLGTAIVPYVQPDMTLEQMVLALIELSGAASNPMLYKLMPGTAEKSIRDVTKRLLASGAIKDTGRKGESSSSTPPALYGLAAVVEREQAEAEQWREDVIDAKFAANDGGQGGRDAV